MQMIQSLGTNHFIYRGMMVGGQARGVLISVIFEKAMNISGRAKAGGKEVTDGPETENEVHGKETEKPKAKPKPMPIAPESAQSGEPPGLEGLDKKQVMSVMQTPKVNEERNKGLE